LAIISTSVIRVYFYGVLVEGGKHVMIAGHESVEGAILRFYSKLAIPKSHKIATKEWDKWWMKLTMVKLIET
jgi:hypothetical protein